MFLPISKKDMKARGWDQCDFVYVIGDAYVDHSSFGHAIISRILEHAGYKVGIISQPDWKDPASISILGRPRLGFLVMGGNMDSMVNHYSVFKHHRKTDAYTPGGKTGKRPDYATVVYCNLIRQTYKDAPIIIGGMEASLRRLAHYDYWSDKMKRSILLDSQADLLLYGMGERSIVEVADALDSGLSVHDLTFLDGTVYKSKTTDQVVDGIVLPDWETVRSDKTAYARSFYTQYRNTDPFVAKPLIEPYGKEFVIQNPPQKPLSREEMDLTYALPYENTYHPSYEKLGGVPAIKEVKFSLTSCRGCFGGCSFCAITFHPSGQDHPDPQPGIHPARGRGHDPRPGIQGLYPRRGRSDRQLPGPSLRKTAHQGRLPREAMPLPEALPEHEGRSFGLRGSAAQAPRPARREKGLHPKRHPL